MKFKNIDTSRLSAILYKYRIVLVWLIILGLLGFTLLQAMQITQPQLDERYLDEQREAAAEEATSLQLSEELRQQIESLQTAPFDISLDGRGQRDPFNP